MSYYDTIEEDLARAKAILAEGKLRNEDLPAGASPEEAMSMLAHSGTIYGKDIFAAYKLLESFVAHIETHFRPDHNGECLNCDNWEDAHGVRDQAENFQLLIALLGATDYKSAVLAWKRQRDELTHFYGLFSDYEDPCESFDHAQAIWNEMKRREDVERTETRRLRALIDAVGEDVCKLALRQLKKLRDQTSTS